MNTELGNKTGISAATSIIGRMAALREEMQLTLADMASRTPFTQSHLSTALRSNNMSLTTACILATALGYTIKLVKLESDAQD